MRVERNAFRTRSFFTLLLFLFALISAVSGIALYLRPEGSLARWTDWTWLGLDKKHWEAVHTVFVLLSLFAAMVHLWYNWKPLANYLRSKAALILRSGKRVPLGREFLAAAAIVSILFYGSISQWLPISLLVDLRSDIKDGKYTVLASPPAAEADKLSLSELCRVMGISEQLASEKARAHEIDIASFSLTLGEIAEQNGLTPQAMYLLLRQDFQSVE